LKLLVSGSLFLHDSALDFVGLLDLLLFKKADVLVLEVFVHSTLLDFGTATRVLLGKLLVKFFLDQTLAFLVSHNCLLLLLVVKKGVELLDGSPFILFFNLRVDFSASTMRA